MESTTLNYVRHLNITENEWLKKNKTQSIWRQQHQLNFGSVFNLKNISYTAQRYLIENDVLIEKKSWMKRFSIRLNDINIKANKKGHIDIEIEIQGSFMEFNIPANTILRGSINPKMLKLVEKEDKAHKIIDIIINLNKVDWIDIEITEHDAISSNLLIKIMTIFTGKYFLLNSMVFPTTISNIKIPSPSLSDIVIYINHKYNTLCIGFIDRSFKPTDGNQEYQYILNNLSKEILKDKSLITITKISNYYLINELINFSNQILKKYIEEKSSALYLNNFNTYFINGVDAHQSMLKKYGKAPINTIISDKLVSINNIIVSIGFDNSEELYVRFLVEVDSKVIGLNVDSVKGGATAKIKMDYNTSKHCPSFDINIDFIHTSIKNWFETLLEGYFSFFIKLLTSKITFQINEKINHAISENLIIPNSFLKHAKIKHFTSNSITRDIWTQIDIQMD
ncbi:hypothetical protein A8C32_08660 [Flavivirga aquatica]|uniref:Uncharacterized protein n=1 Tax=Flavivirga aquatica TaxID=1849968 RepID=A0A1E5SJF2_9FLAO|nr:hypothetical protein [Flavivirga aquatica]OEJ99231.1 hypothetical protein A8C32_08660 [Flavivirga aquatica]